MAIEKLQDGGTSYGRASAIMPAEPTTGPVVLHQAPTRAPQTVYTRFIKRSMDVVVSAAMLVVLSPILAIIALAIVFDSSGPALFRQTRIGKDGRPFTIYKFRTMYASRSSGLKWQRDDDGSIRHKLEHDARVTRIGHILRKASVDELPQLINILVGHMSLIGPRPELPEIVQDYEPWQHSRHLVRPGLTGWWQVNGRSTCPMHEHTDMDLYYIDNMSPSLDFRILLRTFVVVIRSTGAF